METRKLLISESAGIYIPRNFYENFDFGSWGLNVSEYSELSDPDKDGYWDDWQDVLDNAEHTDSEGITWRLEQDGDLWAVNAEFDGFEPITESELEERYNDMLDDLYGEVSIAGLQYQTSHALREVDAVAYRCGFADWISAEIDDCMIKEDANGQYWVQS
jgi:hypothetical protein